MGDLKKIGNILILLGGLIGLIEGILLILGLGIIFLPSLSLFSGIITGILAIIFALIALVNAGFVRISSLEFKNKWLVILIVGILLYIFGSQIGGILVIIGAILLVIE